MKKFTYISDIFKTKWVFKLSSGPCETLNVLFVLIKFLVRIAVVCVSKILLDNIIYVFIEDISIKQTRTSFMYLGVLNFVV